jgi:hypothetical protein
MSSDAHSSASSTIHKRGSFATLPLAWLSARFRDIMIAAEVLHDIQWAAPWDDSQSPASGCRQPETAARR